MCRYSTYVVEERRRSKRSWEGGSLLLFSLSFRLRIEEEEEEEEARHRQARLIVPRRQFRDESPGGRCT